MKKILTIILLLILIIVLYSHFIATKGLVIREYAILNKKIPTSFDGLKIVHFSDLHYGSTIREKEMNNLVDKINLLKPDLVFFTGDLIEEGYYINEKEINQLTKSLNKIEANINKYYINGNHDNNPSYEKVISNSSFINLNNKNDLIYNNENIPIRIVGLDDELLKKINIDDAFNYDKEEIYYTIVLTHEPDTYDYFKDNNIDLVLAGHSHNGQVRIPFLGAIHTPIGSKKYYDEKYLFDNTQMYISGGIGTSTYPFRFLVKPSFNFYRLYKK